MAHVLDPVRIGTVEIKNRVVFPSMCVFFCNEEGYINDIMLEYVRERAKGGVGLIVIPGSPHGKDGPGRPALSHNGYIAGWKKMADIVHQYGAKLFCQLHPAKFQAGRGYAIDEINDFTPEYIRALIDSYALCAVRAKQAGVDGVEIHGAHAHEVAQFMSPFYNHRVDDYGGSTENRARFATEIVQGIKQRVGSDYPLIFRISGKELVAGGREIEETVEIARLIEAAGADAIHVSCGMPESEYAISAPMDVEDMFNIDNVAKVKAAVSIPVIAVNRIVDMEEAETVIQSGKADLVALARANLADPDLVAKYEGKVSGPVRHCLGCNQGCRDVALYKKICCMQNARLGYETTLNFVPVSSEEAAQKIIIVGAGPAGLEAAYDLCLRGFKPVIYEKEPTPGGLVNLAAIPPKKERMHEITNFRVAALRKAGIEIRCGVEVTPELIAQEAPDVLIIATGSTAIIPDIPGIDDCNVITADQILSGVSKLDGSHIVVLGGGLVGCEVADYLSEQGRQVEIIEMTDSLSKELNKSRRYFLLKRLAQQGVTTRLMTKVENISLPEVGVRSGDYSYTLNNVDGIVLAAGRKSQDLLSEVVKSQFPQIRTFVIGDASKPGVALNAIHQAARVAAKI